MDSPAGHPVERETQNTITPFPGGSRAVRQSMVSAPLNFIFKILLLSLRGSAMMVMNLGPAARKMSGSMRAV